MNQHKLSEKESNLNNQLELLGNVFKDLPFNKVLGLQVSYIKPDRAGLDFPMKDTLIGNQVQGILHGGVISAALDTTGGLTATASALEKMQELSLEQMVNRIVQIGTIDMRIDYLRPGRGEHFYTTGTVMRTGKKIAVTRMELKNEQDLLIAVGTGTYIVG